MVIISIKNKYGFTLVELIVTLSIFSIVIVAAGSAIYSAVQGYTATVKMLDDEYNARVALLSITREAHRGITDVEYSASSESKVLIMKTIDDFGDVKFEAKYELGNDGILRRHITTGDTPVVFIEAELVDFQVVDTDNRINIRIAGQNGLELETVISLIRIPQAGII